MESRRVSKNIRFRQKKKKIGLQLLATDEISHRSIREYFYKVKAKVNWVIRENNLNIFGTIITVLNLIINFNLIILLN